MTQAILGGLLTPAQARRAASQMTKHLLLPDGAHLMDKPLAYRGGPETIFRRGESAAYFGREIGLMYVHAHLRYGEAMAAVGDSEALWDALVVANPIAVTETLAHAALRQRNAYFSSSDAAFRDRYEASANWEPRQDRRNRGRGRLAHLFQRSRPLRLAGRPARARRQAALRQTGRQEILPASQKGLRLAGVRRPAERGA